MRGWGRVGEEIRATGRKWERRVLEQGEFARGVVIGREGRESDRVGVEVVYEGAEGGVPVEMSAGQPWRARRAGKSTHAASVTTTSNIGRVGCSAAFFLGRGAHDVLSSLVSGAATGSSSASATPLFLETGVLDGLAGALGASTNGAEDPSSLSVLRRPGDPPSCLPASVSPSPSRSASPSRSSVRSSSSSSDELTTDADDEAWPCWCESAVVASMSDSSASSVRSSSASWDESSSSSQSSLEESSEMSTSSSSSCSSDRAASLSDPRAGEGGSEIGWTEDSLKPELNTAKSSSE